MSTRQFLTNIAVVVTVMAVAALLEAAVPLFARASPGAARRAANLGLTIVVFLLNWALSSAAAIVALAVSFQPTDLGTRLGVPMLVQIVTGIILLDFSAGYLAHRALHLLPVLWRFHRVHHCDDFVDVTIRLWSPLDGVLSLFWVTPNVHKIHHSRETPVDAIREEGPAPYTKVRVGPGDHR